MADRHSPSTDAQLGTALARLGAEIDYPPTPTIADAIVARLVAERERSRPRVIILRSRWLLAVALLLALLLGTLAVSPSARTAIADRLGLGGVDITHLPFVPTPTAAPATTTAPTPGPALRLGQPTTLEAARARLSFAPLRPAASELGEPDEVYLGDGPPGGWLALAYRARPGLRPTGDTGIALLLIQFRGALEPGILGKGLGPGSRLENVDVAGNRGVWIDGDPHVVMFRGPDGTFRDDQVRLAGNVLLWERGELTLRIEGGLGKDAALRIAASVR